MSTATIARPGPGIHRERLGRATTQLAGIGLLLLAWYLLGALSVLDESSIPTLPHTVQALGHEVVKGSFWGAVGHTVEGWALGLVLGALAGLVLGTVVGLNRTAYQSTVVVVEFLKTVPIIAILPLAILVFGTTLEMKVLLVAFGVMWPLTVQTTYGVRAMDPVVRDTATTLGVGRLRLFFTVVLPSASPFIATGLRVAAAGALILTIVIELVAGGAGLGVEIQTAAVSGISAVPVMYARILAAGVLGVAVTMGFSAVERRLLRWHEAYRPVQR